MKNMYVYQPSSWFHNWHNFLFLERAGPQGVPGQSDQGGLHLCGGDGGGEGGELRVMDVHGHQHVHDHPGVAHAVGMGHRGGRLVEAPKERPNR